MKLKSIHLFVDLTKNLSLCIYTCQCYESPVRSTCKIMVYWQQICHDDTYNKNVTRICQDGKLFYIYVIHNIKTIPVAQNAVWWKIRTKSNPNYLKISGEDSLNHIECNKYSQTRTYNKRKCQEHKHFSCRLYFILTTMPDHCNDCLCGNFHLSCLLRTPKQKTMTNNYHLQNTH